MCQLLIFQASHYQFFYLFIYFILLPKLNDKALYTSDFIKIFKTTDGADQEWRSRKYYEALLAMWPNISILFKYHTVNWYIDICCKHSCLMMTRAANSLPIVTANTIKSDAAELGCNRGNVMTFASHLQSVLEELQIKDCDRKIYTSHAQSICNNLVSKQSNKAFKMKFNGLVNIIEWSNGLIEWIR